MTQALNPGAIGVNVKEADLKAMWFEEAFRLLQVGVSSNWWGLGCPSHCQGSLLLLLLTLGFGVLLGVVFTVWFFRDSLLQGPRREIPSYSPPPPTAKRPSDLRLRAYLHE